MDSRSLYLAIKRFCTVGVAWLLLSASVVLAGDPPDHPDPSAVGWGNLFVPGLGATLRERPAMGLIEASVSLTTFYGGTLLGKETSFKIDGTVSLPDHGSLRRPLTARLLQQVGLKYHFYNTFHHYQEASIAVADSETERAKESLQPLYRGHWDDVAVAPFQWQNISSPWSWPVILGVGGFLFYDYATEPVGIRRRQLSTLSESLYGTYSMAAMPYGSSFGEDPLFRGFMQRELHYATGSLPVAIAIQAGAFSYLHTEHVTSFLVGTYFGIETHYLRGDLGPMMAAHFWINVISGVLDYFSMRRAVGRSAPLSPPLAAQIQIPF